MSNATTGKTQAPAHDKAPDKAPDKAADAAPAPKKKSAEERLAAIEAMLNIKQE